MSNNVSRDPTNSYTRRTVEIPIGSRFLYISGQTATDEDGNTPADAEIRADILALDKETKGLLGEIIGGAG